MDERVEQDLNGHPYMSQSFELRREAHAIAEFHASIQLFQPVSGSTLARVNHELKLIASELNLPAAMPIQIFQFNLGNQMMSPQAAGGPAGASGYQRFSEMGEITAALVCDANSITFTLRNYGRWSEVKATLSDVFSRLLREYIVEVPAITSVRLQYVNEFRAKDSLTKVAGELFRLGSPWLSPFVVDATDDWHCNVGKYVAAFGDRRDLVNVNASSMIRSSGPEETPRVYATAMILAGCFYNIPNQSPLVLDPEHIVKQIEDLLDAAHSLEKSVLAETLSDTYLTAIGANDVN